MIVIFKLGGSLLTLPGLADKLRVVLGLRSDQRCLILTGGGAAADAVREWSRIHQLDDETAHWLAIASMNLNREFLGRLLPETSVSDRDQARLLWANKSSPLLLDMARFATTEEASGQSLPHNWNVTSDSLAAWAAIRWPAEELVMLKSVPIPTGLSADDASERELVDPYFPRLAPQIQRIFWCNLRAPNLLIERWL